MARSPSPIDSRPPWLDDEDDAPTPAPVTSVSRRLLWLVLLGIVLLGAGISIGIAIIAKRADAPIEVQANGGEAPLIRSPGPWKTRPEEPGGKTIEGQGQVVFDAGDGADPGGTIDLNALPEDPVLRPGAPAPVAEPLDDAPAAPRRIAPPVQSTREEPSAASPATAPITPAVPKPAPTRPAPRPEVVLTPVNPAPRPTPVPAATVALPAAPAQTPASGGGTTLQLGAFSTEAKAREAWKSYSKRFGYLAGLTPVITPVKRDDATLYRLRLSGAGPAAANLCQRLKVASEPCVLVD